MTANISYYLLTGLTLLFTCNLAARGKAMNRYRNHFFILAIVLLLCIMGSDMLYLFAENNGLLWLQIATTTATFTLAPFMSYAVVLIIRARRKMLENIMVIPAIVNALFAIGSAFTGAYYTFDADRIYQRGPLFPLSMVISCAYIVVMLFLFFRQNQDTSFSERIFFVGIVSVTIFGIWVQTVCPEVSSMWPSMGLSLLLYYAYMLERSARYDSLAETRNRKSFEDDIESLTDEKHYTVISIDINGLKYVNDHGGHDEGDKLIMDTAVVLRDSFSDIGRIYRVGGDEFCVIIQNPYREWIQLALGRMEKNLFRVNKTRTSFLLYLSFGLKEHDSDTGHSFNEVYKEADEAMYHMKKMFYEANPQLDGRRH